MGPLIWLDFLDSDQDCLRPFLGSYIFKQKILKNIIYKILYMGWLGTLGGYVLKNRSWYVLNKKIKIFFLGR